MNSRKTSMLGVGALLLFLFVGCGGAESTVRGTVTVDGNTLERGTVTFHPTGGGAMAYSSIDPSGSYSLKTGASTEIAIGDYKVTVLCETEESLLEPEVDPVRNQAAKGPELVTPEKYGALETTPLQVSVVSGSNSIPLELVFEDSKN